MTIENLGPGIDAALASAAARGILPTHLSSRQARERLAGAVLDRAVWSARTTRAEYLLHLREVIDRMLTGGRDSDIAQLRLELKNLLRQLRYDPETGFPGDEALGIPPAEPGSLTDLGSDRRINLILRTQEQLTRGAAQEVRGLARADLFPAWELVRYQTRRVPRGEGGTKSWDRRWFEAGALPIYVAGQPRLIALKTDPVWAALGNSGLFPDAMDVTHPPFAFNSGMGWRELDIGEWRIITGAAAESRPVPETQPETPAGTPAGTPAELPTPVEVPPGEVLPPAVEPAAVAREPDWLARIRASRDALRESGWRPKTMEEILAMGGASSS